MNFRLFFCSSFLLLLLLLLLLLWCTLFYTINALFYGKAPFNLYIYSLCFYTLSAIYIWVFSFEPFVCRYSSARFQLHRSQNHDFECTLVALTLTLMPLLLLMLYFIRRLMVLNLELIEFDFICDELRRMIKHMYTFLLSRAT